MAVDALELASGPRVHGEDHGILGLNPPDHAEKRTEGLLRVDVAGAVEREEAIAARLDTQRLEDGGLASPLPIAEQRVDHHIADKMDSPGSNSFPSQVLIGCWLGREKKIGDRIGEHPVDLLRHGPIEAAQPRLDVSEAEAHL